MMVEKKINNSDRWYMDFETCDEDGPCESWFTGSIRDCESGEKICRMEISGERYARLIAAAPEMLEALEMVRAALDPDNLRGDSEEVWCNWVNVMSAMFLAVMVAIKKARGEE